MKPAKVKGMSKIKNPLGKILASAAVVSSMCLSSFVAPAQAAVTPNPIDTKSRFAVSEAYKAKYLPATSTRIDWTGDISTCTPGSQSAASQAQAANVINFYRGLNGLDSISLDPALNTRAQATALMMQANNILSHYPTPDWDCYTAEGAAGAGQSNLFSSSGYGSRFNAAIPIDAYMRDNGSNNHAVGHRRWILEPSTVTMGVGTTAGYNALQVFGTKTAPDRATPAFISYPNAGYSPSQLEPMGRWSLSSTQRIDFRAAEVTVKSGTASLPVTKLEVQDGYGPNTLVFEVGGISFPAGDAEKTYTVEVTNMKKDGNTLSHTYTTQLFDGTVSGPAPAPVPTPTPTPTPTPSPAPTPTPARNSINSAADIVAYDSRGVLWNYGTRNPATSRVKIASVSAGAIPKNAFITDWNADGVHDLITQTKEGDIKFHRGVKGGGFRISVIGTGWSQEEITVGKWKSADKYPSIIARNNVSGELFHHPNPSGRLLGPKTKVASGWNGFTFTLLDWDKDGNTDIVAKNSAGALKLYRTNGTGRLLKESRATIATGWNGMNHIRSVKGHNGPGTVGVIARDAAGTLWYYQANKSSWAARKRLGSSFGSFLISGN